MEINKFIFAPDGHYGYPTSEEGETPKDRRELLEEYCDSNYSAWNQGIWESFGEEPDEDDYETEEEYQEAYEEWEESKEDEKGDCYNEYGNYDVFHNAYSMLSEGVDPDDILNSVFDYDGTSCHDDFMQKAANTEGVVYVISIGYSNEIAIAGNVYPLSESSGEVSEILSNTIVKEYRNKNPKAGVMYKDIKSNIPGIEEKVISMLSPEEYDDLNNMGKGGSMLRRFGVD
jgi:hypothetical protein